VQLSTARYAEHTNAYEETFYHQGKGHGKAEGACRWRSW
jgi:hypothetical protein